MTQQEFQRIAVERVAQPREPTSEWFGGSAVVADREVRCLLGPAALVLHGFEVLFGGRRDDQPARFGPVRALYFEADGPETS
jgi:hypothetical protein